MAKAVDRTATRAESLEETVTATLGDRLFSPADLTATVSGANDLAEAVAAGGDRLAGRVMLVLTDELEDCSLEGAAAFVAPRPSFDEVRVWSRGAQDLTATWQTSG